MVRQVGEVRQLDGVEGERRLEPFEQVGRRVVPAVGCHRRVLSATIDG
jgi:hypothetical protein